MEFIFKNIKIINLIILVIYGILTSILCYYLYNITCNYTDNIKCKINSINGYDYNYILNNSENDTEKIGFLPIGMKILDYKMDDKIDDKTKLYKINLKLYDFYNKKEITIIDYIKDKFLPPLKDIPSRYRWIVYYHIPTKKYMTHETYLNGYDNKIDKNGNIKINKNINKNIILFLMIFIIIIFFILNLIIIFNK